MLRFAGLTPSDAGSQQGQTQRGQTPLRPRGQRRALGERNPLPTACCPLPTAHCLLPTASIAAFVLWPRDAKPYRIPSMSADKKTRTETDTFGPIEVRGRPLLGRAGRALARQLQDRLGEAAIGRRARARHRQARGRRDQHGPRQARQENRRGDREGRAGGGRGQARRPLPARRLADGLGHAVEHERQRGDLEPRHRDARRRDGLEEARAPQRPRQHEPVVQRHLPHRHAHRLRGGDPSPAAAGAAGLAQCA